MTISVVFEAGNVSPRIVRITTDATLAQVTAAGWYKNVPPNQLQPSDELEIAYAQGTSNAATAFFSVSISAGVVTLSVAESGVVLPVVSGHFAVFSGTTGAIADLGYLPSDASKTRVVMAGSAVQVGYIAHYIDVTGTIDDTAGTVINDGPIQSGKGGVVGGFIAYPPTTGNGFLELLAINAGGAFNTIISNSAMGQTSTISIPDPGVSTSKFLLTNSASGQVIATGGLDLSVGSVRALQGNFQAGSDAHAGTFTSFPGTTGNGSFVFAALNAGGAFTTTLKNSVMGQSSVVSIPDPGNAIGQLLIGATATPFTSGNLLKASGTAGLVADQGFAMKSVAQAAVAGGAAAQTVTDAFCTTGSMVVACWNDTTNAVDIQKVAAGNGSFIVTSSGDPGASHLNYIITK